MQILAWKEDRMVGKDKTLYISDLDGTLLDKGAKLSDYATTSLNTMMVGGLNFTVATARTLVTAGRMLAGLNLRLPIILMNGVMIYDVGQGHYIKVNKLLPNVVGAIIDTLRNFETTGLMYELKDDVLTTYYESLEQEPLREFVEEREKQYNKPFRHMDSFSGISPEHVVYFTLIDTYERLRPIHDALAAMSGLNTTLYKDNYSPDLWYLEMFGAGASKRDAVECLRDLYGFDRVTGFGDNLNDLPMFMACDVRVAVENAKSEVRAAADYICGPNDDDGVVRWLEGAYRRVSPGNNKHERSHP